jgi:hypothetical protein
MFRSIGVHFDRMVCGAAGLLTGKHNQGLNQRV